jgi:diacylglycerol kinase
MRPCRITIALIKHAKDVAAAAVLLASLAATVIGVLVFAPLFD